VKISWLKHFDIEDYLEDSVGIFRTSQSDGGWDEFICEECIFCGKRAKLYVNSETGFWICYSCGESGSLPYLIMEVDGISYRESIRRLTEASEERLSRSIADLRRRRERKEKRAAARKVRREQARAFLPDEYIPVWDGENRVWNKVGYLETRGFKLRTAKTFRLGYCLEGDYAGRMIFPIIENGEVLSFQARAMGKWKPKYENPPEVSRGQMIYGIDLIVDCEEVVIVEGPTDVVSCYQKGIPTCAPLGKQVTKAQLSKLRRRGVKRACVLLDPDATEAALKVAMMISDVMPVSLGELPDGKDPDDTSADMLRAVLKGARALKTRDFRRLRR